MDGEFRPQMRADPRTIRNALRLVRRTPGEASGNAGERRRPCPAMCLAATCKSTGAEKVISRHHWARTAIAGQALKSTAMVFRAAEEI